jgi:hypothetical protein
VTRRVVILTPEQQAYALGCSSSDQGTRAALARRPSLREVCEEMLRARGWKPLTGHRLSLWGHDEHDEFALLEEAIGVALNREERAADV